MSVRIRLSRYGTKKKPFYRIVAADSESPRNGRFLEVLGTYDPMVEPIKVTVDEDKLKGWVAKGATATDTARTLLKKAGHTV